MSLSPILPGRLPASLLASRLKRNLDASNQALARLQEQAATGQKFFLPSESPASAIRTLILQKTFERKVQLRANLNTDRSLLTVSESVLTTVSDALNQAKSFALGGLGSTTTSQEKEAMAVEVAALIRDVVNAGNTTFRGRYLFGGSESRATPFQFVDGAVSYRGDRAEIQSYLDLGLLLPNNVDGATAFGALTEPVGTDLDPSLTLTSRIADLHSGRGVELGTVVVTLDGAGGQTADVDLSGAETIADVKTRIENAFSPGPPTVTVSINAAGNGLQLSSPDGNVAVADIPGSTVAADLGIASGAVAQIDGADLDPRVTLETPIAALNGGAGIDTASGLLIQNGPRTHTVDLSDPGITTVEDVLNALRLADPHIHAAINDAGNGLAVSSRLSGTGFSIGENGGTTAADLGIRTLDGTALLSELNFGTGVPFENASQLEITRRDGSTLEIDLSSAATVQDVIDLVNAADPPYLSASLNAVGNGISITDYPALSFSTPIVPGQLGAIEVTLDNGALQAAVIDLSSATTLGEVRTLLEDAFPGPPTLTVDINPATGRGLRLTASAGTVQVAESGGGTSAADLGILGGPAAVINGADIAPELTSSSPLIVTENALSTALGLAGEENSGDPAAPLVGSDVHQRETTGVLNVLVRLETALRAEDDGELARISDLIDRETVRFNQIRGELGTRLQLIDRVESRLLDEDVEIQESISEEFDVDLSEVVLQVSARQQTLEATLRIAASTVQLSLLSYL